MGNSFLLYPFKVNWLTDDRPGPYPARVLVGASRKYHKKAVDRNRIKRIVREAYRKNKYVLYEYLQSRGKACNISLIYVGKGELAYSAAEEKIIVVLERLISELEQEIRS